MNREPLTWSPPSDRELIGVRNSPIDLTIFGPRQGTKDTTSQPLWKASGRLVFLQRIPTKVTQVRFAADAVQSYDPSPLVPGDGDFGHANILDDGATLELTGNAWKAVKVNYQVTSNTFLEFDFSVSSVGEIQGFGFDVNLQATVNQLPIRKLFGTQTNWPGGMLQTISGYPGSGTTRFSIHVQSQANFGTGLWQYLVLVNDDDADASGVCRFSNVRFVERPVEPTEISTRNYFISQEERQGGPGEQYPGVVAARVRLDTAEVRLLGESFLWRSTGALEVDLLLAVDPQSWHRVVSGHVHSHFHEAVCIGGQIDLDPFQFQRDSNAIRKWTVNVFEGLNPKLTSDQQSPKAVSLTPSGLSLLGSPKLPWTTQSLSEDLPFLVSLPLDGHSNREIDYLHIRVDEERIRAKRFQPGKEELIGRLDQLEEITRLPGFAIAQTTNAPRWLSLQLNRQSGLPVFHWEKRSSSKLEFVFQQGAWELGLSDSVSGPRANLRCFPNVKVSAVGTGVEKVLTLEFEHYREQEDRDISTLKVLFNEKEETPTDLPDSLDGIVILNRDSIGIDDPSPLLNRSEAKIGQAIADLEGLPNDKTPSFRLAVSRVSAALRRYTSRLNYAYDSSFAVPERLGCERVPMGYQPLEVAEFLRDLHGVPSPSRNDFEVTAEDWVNPPVLWGFMKLEDGWAELPFLNLTDQVYTDLFESLKQPPISFVSGAAVFSNEPIGGSPPENEHLWSLSLTDVAGVKGAITFRPEVSSGQEHLSTARIEWLRPNITIEGLVWMGTTPPRREDGLPEMDNWLTGLKPLVLRTLDEQTSTPSPFQFELNQLLVTPREQSGEFLGGWTLSISANDDPTLIDRRLKSDALSIKPLAQAGVLSWLLASGPFSEALLVGEDKKLDPAGESPFQRDDLPPLIWRRHPSLPVVQSLPLTQGLGSTYHPASSRELMPLHVKLQEFSLRRVLKTGDSGETKARELWLPSTIRFGVLSESNETALQAATAYPTLLVKTSESSIFSEALLAYPSLSGVFLSLPGWTWQPQDSLGVQWQDLWPDNSKVVGEGLRIQMRAGVPVLDQTVALISHDAINTSEEVQSNGALALANPARGRDEIPGRAQYPVLWRELNEKNHFAECAAEFQLDVASPVDANKLHIENLVEPLVWEVSAVGSPIYPGRVEFRNSDGESILLLEGINALRGIEGSFAQDGDSRLVLNERGPWQVVAGSLQSPLGTETISGAETRVLRDQRGWSRGFAQQPGIAPDLVSRPMISHRAGDKVYQLQSLLKPLKLQAGRAAADRIATWLLSFTDVPIDKTGSYNGPELRSKLAEDINDPASSAADRAPLTGYQWSLTHTNLSKKDPLLLADVFPFFPLRLQGVKITDGTVTEVSVAGRLQLPMFAKNLDLAHEEMDRWSNAVIATFTRNNALETLRLTSIDSMRGERLDNYGVESVDERLKRASVPAEIQWPLVYDGGAPEQEKQAKPMLVVMPPGYKASLSNHFSKELPTIIGQSSTLPKPLRTALADRGINVPESTTVLLDANKGWVFADEGGTQEFQMRLDSVGLSVFANPERADKSIAYSETPAGISVIALRNVLVTFSFQDVVWTRLLNTDDGTIALDASEDEVTIEPNGLVVSGSTVATGHVNKVRIRLKPSQYGTGNQIFKYSHQVFLKFVGLWGEDRSPQVEFVSEIPLIDGVQTVQILDQATNRFVLDEPNIKSYLSNSSGEDKSKWELGYGDHGGFKADLERGVIEFQWKKLKPIVGGGDSNSEVQAPEVLPGFHVSIAAESDAQGQTEVPQGFAVMTFEVSGSVGQEPQFTARAGFVEALLPCRWGSEMPGDEEINEKLLAPESLYKSSSGDVYANITWALVAKQDGTPESWNVVVLLNGLLEVTNLVSWPVLEIDHEDMQFSLPTKDMESDRYHHVQRMLLNQHRLPKDLITSGEGGVLFSLRDDKVWRPVAAVEHRISRVRNVEGELELLETRCFCLSQEIRLGTPAAFKAYLLDLKNRSTVDPRRDNRIAPIPDTAMGYQSRSMLEDLLADPLIAGTNDTPVLMVEGSVHALVGKEPRASAENVSYGVVQVLPRASQQAQLLDIADYHCDFDGTNTSLGESPWTILSLPFLGRLQNQNLDYPDSARPTTSRLHADPILQMQASGASDRLLLNFTSRGSSEHIVMQISVFERQKHRDRLRVDPNTVLEGIIRLQSTHRVVVENDLGGVMFSGLSNEVSRVFREQTLTSVLDTARKDFPPKRNESLDVTLHNSPNSFSWYPNARWIMQGTARFGSGNVSDERVYGVSAVHIFGLMESMRLAEEQTLGTPLPFDQRSFTCHPAVTMLPVMRGQVEAVHLQPVAYGVSPCIALRQKRLSIADDNAGEPLMTFAELLCLSADGSRLEVVLTRTWKAEGIPSPSDLEAWGKASHERLAIDSPVAVIRTRQLLTSATPGQAALDFEFYPLPSISQTPKLSGHSTSQSSPATLRRAVEPQRRDLSALHNHPVERVGPQPGFVQPLYLRNRPPVSLDASLSPDDPSQAPDNAIWPNGLSALHVDVRTTREGVNPVGTLVRSEPGGEDNQIDARVWWNSDRIDVQYRINEDERTRRLPKLFRSSAVGGFLSSMTIPSVPLIRYRDLTSEVVGYPSLSTFWQTWLSGRYRYLIQAARPGAPLLFHHRLVMSEKQSLADSGSTAMQYRMTRPMHLPPNLPGDTINALQTVGTSFALHDPPRRLFAVPDWPAIFTAAGRIHAIEFAITNFDALDKNSDGFLTANQTNDNVSPLLWSLIQAGDTNSDGAISLAELNSLLGHEGSHQEDGTGTASTSLDPDNQILAILPNPERVSSLVVKTIDATTWTLVVTLHSDDEVIAYLVNHDSQIGIVKLEQEGSSDNRIPELPDWRSKLTKEKLQQLRQTAPSSEPLLALLDIACDDSENGSFLKLIVVTTLTLRGLLTHIATETTNQSLRDEINALIPKITDSLAIPSSLEVAEAIRTLMPELESVRDLAAIEPLTSQVSHLTILLANPPEMTSSKPKPWREPANPLVSIQRDKPSWLARLEFANQHLVFFPCHRERSIVFAQGPALLDVTTGSKDSFFVETREALGFEIQLNSAVIDESAIAESSLEPVTADMRLHGLVASDINTQDIRLVSLVDGRTFSAQLTAVDGVPNRLRLAFEPTTGEMVKRWMRLNPDGAPLALQIVVGLNADAQSNLGLEVKGFRQQLNLLLRLQRPDTRHSPHEPRFQLFEDPEYNRSLATAPARSAIPVPFELVTGGTKQLFELTIVADRAEYTSAERIFLTWYVATALFRLDVLPDQFPIDPSSQYVRQLFAAAGYPTSDDLNAPQKVGTLRRWTIVDSSNNHKFEIRVGQDSVVVHAHPVVQPTGKMKIQVVRPSGASVELFNDTTHIWEPDQLREVDFADRKVLENGSPVYPLRGDTRIGSGDALIVSVSIESGGETQTTTVRLNIVENSTLPAPSASYALLHSRDKEQNNPLPGKSGVSVPRFAWSPLPLRVEMVNPDDLKGAIVRRRAVFQWSHTIRKRDYAQYALQKCTAIGETHIPSLNGPTHGNTK